MITDQLSNIGHYRGLSPRLDLALEFLLTNDLAALPTGRIEIDGDHLYGNHMNYMTSSISDDKMFEVHKRYIDIQMIVSGHEWIALAPMNFLTKVEDRPEDDVTFYTGKHDHIVMLREHTFMLLFPGEAHIPGLAIDKQATVTKLVLKVAY